MVTYEEVLKAVEEALETRLSAHTPLAELIPTNTVYLPLTITAIAGTTTTANYYPTDGRIWFIGKVRIVTSANTKAIQKARCKETEVLNQIYAQQDVAIDSEALTPAKYYYKDELGAPLRTVQLEFVFDNVGTANEDQTVEIFGTESIKKYSSPPLLPFKEESNPTAYFKVPCVDVTVEDPAFPIKPVDGIAPTVSFKTGKYCTQYPMLCICSPNYDYAVVKTDDEIAIETIRADAECEEITEAEADALVESWYVGYAFNPEDFSLRKVPNVFGIHVRTLKDAITMELISYDSLPHLVQLDGFKFYIQARVG